MCCSFHEYIQYGVCDGFWIMQPFAEHIFVEPSILFHGKLVFFGVTCPGRIVEEFLQVLVLEPQSPGLEVYFARLGFRHIQAGNTVFTVDRQFVVGEFSQDRI